ncbi:MAG: SET domain-containing protein-lysine N-methyltransferase [Nitrospiraceae bacterium]|nr:SET domain-containing protein-lysine N-methyltransferase [Nitrospiraceae bacterium]
MIRKPSRSLSRTTKIRFAVRSGPSGIEGTGVFADAPIPGRTKIGEVTGELISIRTARKRAREGCRLCLIDVSDARALDCTGGNVLRHLNHSCRSNAFLRIMHERVEVYARRAIRSGEEITVDYGESPHSGGMKCRCGDPACRDRI